MVFTPLHTCSPDPVSTQLPLAQPPFASDQLVMTQEERHLLSIHFLPLSLSPCGLAESEVQSTYGVLDNVVI